MNAAQTTKPFARTRRAGTQRCVLLFVLSCVIAGSLFSCSPFYAGLSAGSSPDEDGIDRDALWTAVLIALSQRPVRTIFLTNSLFDGESDGDFGATNGTGIDEADRHCNGDSARPFANANFAALLSDGLNRVATTSPNCRNNCTGQIDWPLRSYTDYVLTDGRLIFGTQATPIFVFGELTTAVSTEAGTFHWTGLQSDWRSADNCARWTTIATGTGRGGQTTAFDEAWLNAAGLNCSVGARLICVQL
ncbi:MAG: DUF1554 domain-containing protein [bacterium]|nr:DUF1554 domain-containing protein [bacterium]